MQRRLEDHGEVGGREDIRRHGSEAATCQGGWTVSRNDKGIGSHWEPPQGAIPSGTLICSLRRLMSDVWPSEL